MKLKRQDRTMKKADEFKGSRGSVTTTQILGFSFLQTNDVDSKINEHYLFHGCPNEIAPLVTKDGLDLRLARDGMLGRGTYGAENPTKSDQYAGILNYSFPKMYLY